jgi:tetratricopeptide (TPR) repeat protein
MCTLRQWENEMTEQQSFDESEQHLEGLDAAFMDGVKRLESGNIDGAAEAFRRILKKEPRLAEPRIELARILVETGQLREAEAEIRESLRILEGGGLWLDSLPEDQVKSVAFGMLAEVLRRLAETDDVVFGDPEAWRAIVDESHAAFRKARELDPSNAHATYWAGGLDVDSGADAPIKEDEPTD